MERYTCVWDAICDTPEEAREMRSRSRLLMHLDQLLNRLSDASARQLLGVSTDRLDALRRGKIDLFSLEELMGLARRIGISVIEIDGEPATIQHHPEIGMHRGEFIALAGGADFYAADRADLEREGRLSLKTYREARVEEGPGGRP
ncbi:helix-turn-helix domain-containing protein [Afifella sp. YEN Y35]|uniref:helix-turn-helix domain-containing protein n=1 Tax=Afifella sp. YEN Y35 TaxID=3388337 RepID=UPI0039DF6049